MNLTEFIESRREQHLAELCEFLRIPSVSAKSENKPDIERAAKWVAEHLRAAGFPKSKSSPPIFIHWCMQNHSRHREPRRYFSTDIMTCSPQNHWSCGLRRRLNRNLGMEISMDGGLPTTRGRCTFISRRSNRFTRCRQVSGQYQGPD